MKVLLAAVNAKYIHSNLAIYSLKANCGAYESQVKLMEYSINQYPEDIFQNLYQERADVICFSCYIWNIGMIEQVAGWLHQVAPHIRIWFGGPEVSFDVAERLESRLFVEGIMYGEGEDTFRDMMAVWNGDKDIRDVSGIGYRQTDGRICIHPARDFVDMSRLNFVYTRPEDFKNKIIYYETSRGCPFQCSYCLSSVEKKVRFRDLELVKKELQQFIDWEIPQVKFVDRTFNCKREHSMEILKFIKAQDKGKTNFHFEVTADLLNDEELEFMAGLRPGLIQLEIGVQSTNPETLKEIRRYVSFKKLSEIVRRIHAGGNIHQHLDLIAGLPFEDLQRFKQSFNDVYALKPEQLQLGFLKVLKGSYMREQDDTYGLIYRPEPPYEIMATRWLGYDDLLVLKSVEEMVEVYYNSRQFENSLDWLEGYFPTAFDMYEALARYYETEGLKGISHSRMARYEILLNFVRTLLNNEETHTFVQILTYDLYLRENVKSRPDWALKQDPYTASYVEFFRDETNREKYFAGYETYTTKQIQRMTHIEYFDFNVLAKDSEDAKRPVFVWFDYLNRDPLTYKSRNIEVDL
ncbi:B12-binding domain-containing radical SAM protein [Frisingicoccus sp.]|uniref:B12-binding domain-containing radical SAM protein n=1 Tax=Frisingicoccus sp. TaxID=1918627 RepID=UPI002EA2C10A|nr:B12-binding domain-containing radical SAM protein [Frisingicoccus sp.]